MRALACLLLILLMSPGAAAEGANDDVPPQTGLRLADHHAPTPLTVPGARTIDTPTLRALLQRAAPEVPVLFDVLGGAGHASLPGAIWLPGAGRGTSFEDEVQESLSRALRAATRGDLARPLVFFCAGPRCWLSYNAALRAVRLGYRNVLWYRGGIEAWGAGGGALERPAIVWKPQARAGGAGRYYFCLRTSSTSWSTALSIPSRLPPCSALTV